VPPPPIAGLIFDIFASVRAASKANSRWWSFAQRKTPADAPLCAGGPHLERQKGGSRCAVPVKRSSKTDRRLIAKDPPARGGGSRSFARQRETGRQRRKELPVSTARASVTPTRANRRCSTRTARGRNYVADQLVRDARSTVRRCSCPNGRRPLTSRRTTWVSCATLPHEAGGGRSVDPAGSPAKRPCFAARLRRQSDPQQARRSRG